MRGTDGSSKGYGFAEMVNSALTDTVIQAMHGMQMGPGRPITVSRAQGAGRGSAGGSGAPAGGAAASHSLGGGGGGGSYGSASNSAPLGTRSGGGGGVMAMMPAPPMEQYGGAAPSHGGGMGGYAPAAPPPAAAAVPAGVPSRVVLLEGLVASTDELVNHDDYADLLEDVRAEVAKHGALLGLAVPRPPEPAAGRVFVHFADISAAIGAATRLHSRLFGGARVAARYYDEGAFQAGHFTG